YQRLVGDKALKKGEPAVGTRLVQLIFCKKTQKKFHFTPYQRLVGDKALKKGEPAVGTRLVQLIFCKKTQKKFHFIIVYPKMGRK
ncbi:hypothetical protein PDQ05_22305, partial [Bacillus cereus]|nr:hypothetical protein [Bacillus cereus]